jgi:CRP/FNR family cyclic AMP-dependent transcriptional regulator
MDASVNAPLPDLGPLFSGLPEQELRAIASKAVTRTYARNAVVIREGDFTGSLYVILSGKVKVCLGDESGKELILDIKGAGAYFGEMAIDDGPRSASVITLEHSRFAVISRIDFEHILRDHSDIALHVIKDLVHLVRGLNKSVSGLTMLDVYGRVSRLLLDSAVNHDGKLVIVEKLTQKEMAGRLGASREMINRILRSLSVGGYIEIEKKRITINKALPPHLCLAMQKRSHSGMGKRRTGT